MSTKRTYDNYKSFFDEVNKSNNNKTYHYSYVLLFSFFEDRLTQIFRTQCEIKHGVTPQKHEEKYSNHQKLRSVMAWGIPIGRNQFIGIDNLSKRRNEIIHNALFNIKSVNEGDVELLEKISRYFNKMREKQKKDNPKLFPKNTKTSARDRLRLRFSGSLPSMSSMTMVN